MPYLTPPTTPSETVRRCLCIPNHPVWLAAVSGALLELTRAYNWEDIDGITAEQAASRSLQMFEEYALGECGMIGEIKAFVSLEAVPSNCLVFDGFTRAQVDFPLLFAVIPSAWKSGTNFTLPVMIKRTLIGSDPLNPSTPPIAGSTGGEELHGLTVAEMPEHDHPPIGGSNSFVGGAAESGLLGFVAGTSARGYVATGNRGGNTPHNNMPPYLASIWAVVAK